MSHPAALPPSSARSLPDAPALTWQPLSDELVPAWFPLRDCLRRADGHTEFLTEDDLRDELAPPWLDLAQDSRIGLDAEGVARAFGLVEVRPNDTTLLRALCWGGVDPRWRGRGIGRALLEWQLERGREQVVARRAELGADTAGIFVAEIPEDVRDAARLFTRLGLSQVRTSLVMRRSLELPVERRAAPDGLSIVPYQASMDEQLRHAHNSFFADHWAFQPWSQEAWRQWATGHRGFRPDWSFVVMARSEIVGYVVCAAYPDEWVELGFTQGYITKVGTARAWRGRGVASALLTRAMTAFAADGMQFAGLDVDLDNSTGALRVYQRLGFEEWHREGLWQKPL